MDIEQEIDAALAGRAAQRDSVDTLCDAWRQLGQSFGELTAYAAEAGRSAAGAGARETSQRDSLGAAAEYLTPNAPWRMKAEALAGQLEAASGRVDTLHRRVHRETVNIGVIGMTRAGKSTLLRRLSGLTQEHIPSNEYESTTAAPSRIFHEPDGQERAHLTLHTWDTFRDGYLAPLHERAKLGPPPASLAAFRAFDYPRPTEDLLEGKVGTKPYREKVWQAKKSLSSYEPLLTGVPKDIPLDRMRPYVAYPAKNDPRQDDRPYHAVQVVDIFCRFRHVGAVKLGLVDLPGSGEAGLVHGRFLQNMRNDVDLVFIIKRPEKTTAQVMGPDWEVMQLADEAASGVRREDFIRYVINCDHSVPANHLERAVATVREEVERLGFDVRECDIEHDDVTAVVLQPALTHLAERLADMDRDAVQHSLKELRGLAAEVQSLADDLARQVRGWLSGLPNEKRRLRKRVEGLVYDIGMGLVEVLKKYDDLIRDEKPIAELEDQIQIAVDDIHGWIRDGLGEGSPDQWMDKLEKAAILRDWGQLLERHYNNAYQHVSLVFGRIDESLTSSVRQLWAEIADVLRHYLTNAIVPDGSDPYAVLAGFAAMAADNKLKELADATNRILKLQTDYGNIFLRVGRPIVRELGWYPVADGGSPASATLRNAASGLIGSVAPGAVGSAVGAAVGSVAGPQAGQVAGNAASAAVQARINRASAAESATPGAGSSSWWEAPKGRGTTPAPAPPASRGRSAVIAADHTKYPVAAPQYERLVGIIEHVTTELEREFHAEARQAVRVLAAAMNLYLFSMTGTLNVKQDFEELCEPFQRTLWSKDFTQASAKAAADLATLQVMTAETQAAAGRVAVRADQARLL